jgi:hypothetical protein
MISHETHLPALREGRDQENAFDPGEAFADAATRATAEWEVGKLWP